MIQKLFHYYYQKRKAQEDERKITLVKLPRNITFQITKFLDIKSIAYLSQTCYKMN